MGIPKDFNLDVSQVTGVSRDGKSNVWTDWHSTVNNQVPFYLRGRTQPIKPSVSLNAGTNVLFGSQPKVGTTPPPLPKTPPAPVDSKKDEGNWWDDAAKWALTNIALPFAFNFAKDPVKTTASVLNPTSQIPTILGGGDTLKGTMMILDTPGKIATSAMINAGRSAQAVRQQIEGTEDTTDYWADMQKAWDWSLHDNSYAQAVDKAGNLIFEDDGVTPVTVDLHDNLDIGTAWAYAFSQSALLIPSLFKNAEPISEEEEAAFNQTILDWGLVASNTNFDIFNRDQRDQITGQTRWDNGAIKDGSGNGWTLGNIGVQTLNLTGDLALDPLSYVPFGKVGRIAFAGRNLLTNSTKTQIKKRIVEDAGILAEAAAGRSTVYDNFLNFAAKNNAETIANHVVVRSITSGEKDQVAYLLGQVTRPEDAAKVLLAVEYGSTRAIKELVSNYGKIGLALDEQIAGGYLSRGIANGKILPENELLNKFEHEEFYQTMLDYVNFAANDVFSKTLRDTALKIVDGGISPAMAVRELTPVNLKNVYLNSVMSSLDQAGAKVGTFFVSGVNHINSYAVESKFKFGTKHFIHHQIVRLGSKDAKGIIDVTNIDGTATPKFFGMLNDIDRVTKGTLSRVRDGAPTLKSVFTERWLTTTDATARVKLIEEVNEIALKSLLIKHGASDIATEKVVAELVKRNYIHKNNINSTGFSIMNDDGIPIVYHDPFAIGKNNTEVQLWNWNKVDTEFAKQAKPLSNIIATPLQSMTNLGKEINGLFNALVVARPARIARDILSNMITTLGSGYGKEMFLGDSRASIIKSVFSPIERIPANVKTKLIRKGNLDDTVGAIGKLEEEREALATGVLNRWKYITQYMETMPLDKATFDEIFTFLAAKNVLTRETAFHTSPTVLGNLDPKRPFVSFLNEQDAANYAVSRFGKTTPVVTKTPEERLTLSDDKGVRPKTLQELFDAVDDFKIIHVRTKGAKGARRQEWQEYVPAIQKGLRHDLDKYEYRIFERDGFDAFTEDELKALLGSPDRTFFDSTGKMLTPDDAKNILLKEEPIIEMPLGGSQTYKSNFYGGARSVDVSETTDQILSQPDAAYKLPWLYAARLFVDNPTPTTSEITNMMKMLNDYKIGYIKLTDSNGTPVIVGNPKFVHLDSQESDATGEIQDIVATYIDMFGQGFSQQQTIGGRLGLNPNLAKAMRGEMEGIPGTPFSLIDTKDVKVLPMPKGMTLIYKPNTNVLEPGQFFARIGNKNFSVTVGFDSQTRKPIFQIVRPKSLPRQKVFEPDELGRVVAFDTLYQASAIPGVAIRDFIRVPQLRKITKESKVNLEKVEAGNIEQLGKQEALDNAPFIPEDEVYQLEAMLNAGDFGPEVLKSITESVVRYSEVTQQLVHLYDNLNFVTKKVSKNQQKKLDALRARQGTAGIPVAKTPAQSTIMGPFKDLDLPKQEFAHAITGAGGEKWFAKIRGDARDVRDQGASFLVRGSQIKNKVFTPQTSGYWNAWQRTLNEHWRGPDGNLDPVVGMWLQGTKDGLTDKQITEDILSWLETASGQKYANTIGIGKKYATADSTISAPPRTRFEQMTYEDYIEMQQYNVRNHVGDLGPSSVPLRDGEDYVTNDMLFNAKQKIRDKILNNEDVTQEDLITAWLSPRDSIKVNRETGKWERVEASNYGQLPDVWGTYADPVGRRTIADQFKVILRNFNRVVADTPQEVLFQTPLFRAAYAKSVDRLTTQMRIATGRDAFRDAELRTMEEKARSFALAETRKWIYSAQQDSNIMNGIRQVVPFANASVFSIKWMKAVATERPVYAAWMVYEYNKAIGNTQWYDKDGNSVSYTDKDAEGRPSATHFRLDMPSWMINAIAGKSWDDKFGTDYIDSTFISRTSIDPIYAGNNFDLFGVQVPNPFVSWGLSPAPAIAMSELIKEGLKNPESFWGVIGNALKGLFDTGAKAGVTPDITKFGVSTTPGSIDLFIPPILGPAYKNLVAGTADPAELTRLQLNAGTYLYGRYVAGIGPKPTAEMVRNYALGMYDLKFNSSMIMPFATKYVTASDIARQTWQTYLKAEQEEFDALGAEEYTRINLPGYESYELRQAQLPGAKPYRLNPFDVALSNFLNKEPDLFYGAISTGGGNLRLKPQKTTADNLKRYSKYIPDLSQTDEGVDVLSDIMNGDTNSATSESSYVFDQNVYNILVEQNLIRKADPDATARRVNIARGNQLYRQGGVDKNGNRIYGMNELDNMAFEKNVPIEQDPTLSREKARLVKWVTDQKTASGENWGQDWLDNRSNLNPQRYNNYADAWNLVIGLPKKDTQDAVYRNDVSRDNGMFLETVDAFLKERKKWQGELRRRAQSDPTLGTLSKNTDIASQYYEYVFVLKNYDKTGKFSEFYNTYFEGDTIY
jgi:hypothetical protein